MLLLLLCGAAISFAAQAASGHDLIQRGDDFFSMRATGATGDRGDRTYAVNAINAYRQAMGDASVEREASVRLLRALYFLGCYAFSDSQDRLQAFKEAKSVGERMVVKYPGDPDLSYWFSVNLSLWANEIGPLAAIRSGFADKIREVSESAISHGNNAGLAGIYQVMGRMHHLLPRIPFVLSWPDKRLAEQYLAKAVQLDPDNLANHLFLAEFYRDMGRFEDARRVLTPLVSRKPRAGQELEDRRSLWKLHELDLALHIVSDPERVAMLQLK